MYFSFIVWIPWCLFWTLVFFCRSYAPKEKYRYLQVIRHQLYSTRKNRGPKQTPSNSHNCIIILIIASVFFSSGATLPQQNTLVQNIHLQMQTMTEKRWCTVILTNCDQTRVNEADVVSWPISDFVSNAFSTSLGSFWHQHYEFITFPSRVMINFIFVFWSTLFLKIQFTGS